MPDDGEFVVPFLGEGEDFIRDTFTGMDQDCVGASFRIRVSAGEGFLKPMAGDECLDPGDENGRKAVMSLHEMKDRWKARSVDGAVAGKMSAFIGKGVFCCIIVSSSCS